MILGICSTASSELLAKNLAIVSIITPTGEAFASECMATKNMKQEMKDYGYTTEDYVVNSQFNIISSNVIGYEQCVGEDLKNWREFMAKK
tara:strand:- start:269 stop:538 length:270 start_codon:yes stop_codon:yes gene_type:complete